MPDVSAFDLAALAALARSVAGQWIDNFIVDLRRYVFAAPLAWLVICVLLASGLAHRKIRPTRPPVSTGSNWPAPCARSRCSPPSR